MFFAITFIFWRICQVVTLIITTGLLSWFISIFNDENLLTPSYLLVPFIVVVIALGWSFATLLSYSRTSANGSFVAFTDLCFFGALIASAYYMRRIGVVDCNSVADSSDNAWHRYFAALYQVRGVHGLDPDVAKPCAMIKASFAFVIMNVIFFFITGIAAWFHGDDLSDYKYRGNIGHRSSRSRSRSRHSHHERSRSRRRSGSRHSTRRSYSHSRTYV